jgi:hypothetical protein
MMKQKKQNDGKV